MISLRFFQLIIVGGGLIFLLLFSPDTSYAQDFKEEYFKGEVIKIIEDSEIDLGGVKNNLQKVEVKITDGDQQSKVVVVEHGGSFQLKDDQKVGLGDTVVLVKYQAAEGERYSIADKYRLDKLIAILLGFFVMVFLIARKKGVGAILGLVLSFVVIVQFIVPQILLGRDPLLISIIGSLVVMALTIYLAHGFSKQTSIAVFATFLTLIVTGILSIVAVGLSALTGMGSDEAMTLQIGGTSAINLKGLFLGGIIIGTLGALDDITTTQVAAVFELFKVNSKQTLTELFKNGMNIGREHVTSLVNTLVLAYAGAALPLFVLFIYNPREVPYWVILNSENIAEEVVRTLVGSTGLIMAVPLATWLAAWYVRRRLESR